MRDAIVAIHDWSGAHSVERIALTLARLGAKVLHCDSPLSVLRRPDTSLRELETNLFTFRPVILGARLYRLPGMSQIQGVALVRQILRNARSLGLKDPAFVYPYRGSFPLPVCRAMKARGFFLVYVSTDYFEGAEHEQEEREHVELSDLTLAIPRTVVHRLRARWGEKIHQIPQGIDLAPFRALGACPEEAPPLLAGIPRPRLGYAGACADERLNARVLAELLGRHREWSFVSFGSIPAAPLPNVHVLPWQSQEQLARCVAAFDVGFMPYNCFDVVQFNCVPIKLLDYFAVGLPVVATPVIHLWEYEDLVYFGETAEELERAVRAALEEPLDSPKRRRRKEVAEAHSMEAFGQVLSRIPGLAGKSN